MPLATSQLLSKTKPNRPNFENAGWASIASLTKKKPIRARIAAARPVRPHRSTRSGTPASGPRWRALAPPLVMAPASIDLRLAGAAQRRAVALEAIGRSLRLRQERVRQLRVLQLPEDALSLT